ncbi:MAG: hypothetical protein DME06_04135 [Candidatus Rokuibacteriota bacterium]|nr:MAG: hypothetical protein DME06_04135 [Candidatus Rokubacteria bacterium]
MIRRGALLSAFALTLVACGSGAPPLPPPIAAPPKPAAPPAEAPEAEKQERSLPAVTYEPKGNRDPFIPLETTGGPKGLTVASTRLTGIVWDQAGALALLEGADGIGYILRPGDTLGDGRLLEIGADNAVFSVAPRPGAPPTRLTLRLKTD